MLTACPFGDKPALQRYIGLIVLSAVAGFHKSGSKGLYRAARIVHARHFFLCSSSCFFVMGLGYWAGRAKRFDAHQMRGINDVVMTYALPSLMFVATGTTTRSAIFSEVLFLLALLIALLGFYIAVALLSVLVLRHSIGAAGLQAFLITYPSVAFFGIPIFKGLFGGASLVSIA